MLSEQLESYKPLLEREKLLENRLKQSDETVGVVLHAEYIESLRKMYKTRLEIERFLNTIDDAEMRVAIRLYYIEQKTWLQVGVKLGYNESWIRKKTLRFLKNNS